MTASFPEPRTYRYRDIPSGMREQRNYVISPEVYEHFLAAFDDRSPIHVDETYAKTCGFPGIVMHGTLLNGFLSHFIGMYFPGRLSLLLAADLRYAKPCCLGDTISLETTVNQKMDARKIIILDVLFTNLTQGVTAARGRVQVMLREE